MSKIMWKPGTMEYPLPVVLVTCSDGVKDNVCTVAWTGTICTDPAMTYISLRRERFSYDLIEKSGEFVINLTTEDLVKATDLAGVKSGKNTEDKFSLIGVTKQKASIVSCPMIAQSPVNIECKVEKIEKLGSHDMFIAKVVAVDIDDKYLDENGKFDLEKCNLISYSHGMYYSLGQSLGKFGFSVKK